MKDKLLQKKVAMTELNSSNNEMLKKFLNNIIVMIEFTKWINEIYKNDITMWYSKQAQNEYILW